jgi:DNA-binding GntR family transcriptional regulator
LYTLRATLEEFAVELAVERATDEDIEDLAELVESMNEAARQNDASKLVEIDLRFHERLHEMTGHRLLVQQLQSLAGQTRVFIIATKAFYSPFSSLEEAAASHNPILDALRARDARLAREAIYEHIRQVGERYVDQLEAESEEEE